jgi:DNA polymerase III subunit delta
MTTKAAAEIFPVYLIYGPEGYLIDREVEELLDRTLSPKEREMNSHFFEVEEGRVPEIVRTARTVPMFSRYRFVLLNGADRMDKDEVELVADYIRKPSPTTCLVLRGLVLGSWKAHRTEIERAGRVIECGRLKGRGLVAWIRKKMGEKGNALSEEAANYLAEAVGDDLQALESVLEKASLGIGEKRKVGLSDVEGIVSEVRYSTVFDLTDAIGRRDLEKALAVLGKAMESKVVPFKKDEASSRIDDPVPLLLSMMFRQYRQIWRAKELSSRRQGLAEIAKVLRSWPSNVEKLLEQARHFSVPSLRDGILKCHLADRAIKRGRGPKELLMQKLVIDLCRPEDLVEKKRRMKLQR